MSAASRFRAAARQAAGDQVRQQTVRQSLATYHAAAAAGQARFSDYAAARRRAHAVKAEAMADLDRYLLQFEAGIESRGGHVYWAETADDARGYIVGLARRHGVRHVIKSKSMVSEEVGLGAALEAAGVEAVETDLGEYIVQLRHEPPFHIVTPAMHLRVGDIARLFHEQLGTPVQTESAEELTLAARRALRRKFLGAAMGITGANFLIADAGLVAITENEGNARLTAALPRIHVVLTGLEKVLPRLRDLDLFWPLLATAGTGQPITCYNSLIGGPRQPGEIDGPDEFHVVLLDNGRTRVYADRERRESLHCIRCGACLNACPIFHTIGGHAYGSPYSGPIGAVLNPLLRGPEFAHLSYASSLCGACTEVCPVNIDLQRHLIENRRDASQHPSTGAASRGLRLWQWICTSRRRFELAGKAMRRLLRLKNTLVPEGSYLDALRPWTRDRALPPPPTESFREWWRKREKKSPPAEPAA